MSVNMQPKRGRRNILETIQLLTVSVWHTHNLIILYLWDTYVAVMKCLAVLSQEAQGDGGVQTSSVPSSIRLSGTQTACQSAPGRWGLHSQRRQAWSTSLGSQMQSQTELLPKQKGPSEGWSGCGATGEQGQEPEASRARTRGSDVPGEGLEGIVGSVTACPPWHMLWIPVKGEEGREHKDLRYVYHVWP